MNDSIISNGARKPIEYVCTDCGYEWKGEWADFCPVCESELIKQKPVGYDPIDHE